VRENEAWRRPPIERGLRHGTSSRLAPPDLDDNFHTVALEVLSAVPERFTSTHVVYASGPGELILS
jgi:hypothetical protein